MGRQQHSSKREGSATSSTQLLLPDTLHPLIGRQSSKIRHYSVGLCSQQSQLVSRVRVLSPSLLSSCHPPRDNNGSGWQHFEFGKLCRPPTCDQQVRRGTALFRHFDLPAFPYIIIKLKKPKSEIGIGIKEGRSSQWKLRASETLR